MEPWQLQSILQIEGSGRLDVPYLGYVETCLRIPKIKAFDNDVLLLIVPDSAHTHHMPITLGTLHIDMAIRLATKKELKNLNQTDHERGTSSESGRYTNSIKDRQYFENH